MSFLPDFAQHGAFVWSAYGISLVILGGLFVHAAIRGRAAKARLRRTQAAFDARREAGRGPAPHNTDASSGRGAP